MPRSESSWKQPQQGQALIIFALLGVVFVGFLALAVDLGFLFGERRYDQNGSDAAALAVARDLATNVSPDPADQTGNTVYFSTTDVNVFKLARRYGGLDPTSTTTTAPTGTNQNALMNSNNELKVTLEYASNGSNWCYSPASPQPLRTPAVPICGLFSGSYPPESPPGNTNPYRIRVTVSSTTKSSFLATFAALIPGGNSNVGQSGPQTDPNLGACLRVGNGMETCAQTIAIIAGSTTYQGSGPSIPMTTCDTQLNVGTLGTMYDLWNPNNGTICGIKTASWKEVLDFSDAKKWCDNVGPDYKFVELLPSLSHVAGGPCSVLGAPPDQWGRLGSPPYVKDATHPGTGVQKDDVPMWTSIGFGGTLVTGMNAPTYVDDNPSQTGSEGSNIQLGVYCDNTVTVNTCPGNTPTGTYFFAQNQTGFYSKCPDAFGQANNLGCRDATVPTWTTPEEATTCNPGNVPCWKDAVGGGGAPDRVKIVNFRNFRIYCEYAGAECTGNPTGGGASTVSGRYVAPFVTQCNGAICNGPPSLNGNAVSLGA